ncbi:AI-2E family transporter [Leucobacter sp. cx-169]|nr:AI-2E family transporter [Leucobacter sp. cx-169]
MKLVNDSPSVEPSAETPAQQDPGANAASALPLGVRIAAAWSWRLILIAAAAAVFIWLIVQVRFIVIPVLVAILLTALLAPIVHRFVKWGLPRWMGVLTALVALLSAVSMLVFLIVTQFRSGFSDLAKRSAGAINDLAHWLESGVLGLSAEQVQDYIDKLVTSIQADSGVIWSGALSVGTTVTQVIAGMLLTLFSLIFLLIDGKRIWYWVLGFLPAGAHAAIDGAGRSGWVSVGQYVRVQIFVAFVDAVGIGIGAAVLQVPLAIPLAVLVFLGSFIPFLGAIVTGALAAFVALVYNGPVNALIMLGVVVLVNQVEGHILQPLVMGNAVRVHPLGVVLAVSTGALVGGIPGALFAVPLVASANSIVNYLVSGKWKGEPDPVAAFHADYKREHDVRARARRIKRLISKEETE